MKTHAIASVIEEFGAVLGIPNAGLDTYGSWSFVADEFIIRIQIHADDNALECSTLLGEIPSPTEELYETILSANFLFRETYGATIGINRNHRLATLAHRISPDGLNTPRFTQLMENFINVAALWKDHMASGEVPKIRSVPPNFIPIRG